MTPVTGARGLVCDNMLIWIEGADMQRIRIERKAPVRDDRDRFAVLPLDPRDPDILRAKLSQRLVPTRASARSPSG